MQPTVSTPAAPHPLQAEAQLLTRKVDDALEALQQLDPIRVGITPRKRVRRIDRAELYHYAPAETKKADRVRTPLLIVYAMVNRTSMLDLQPDRSFIANLLAHGLDVYLVEWGTPTPQDRYTSLDDIIDGYIDGFVDHIRRTTRQQQVHLAGVCQGGTYATLYAALYPQKVKNLVTIVTPIDFSVNDSVLFRWSRDLDVDKMVDTYGVIPARLMQFGFVMMRPVARIEKYISFLDVADDRQKMENFLRLEQWIFDCPDHPGEAFRQFIKHLYQENRLVTGGLVIGGREVKLQHITMPLLNIYAANDHIVPPAASTPLNDLVGSADKTLYTFNGGHIGVFVSSKTQQELAPAVAAWLRHRDDA
jgi:polyhydroxyalkanoate synthase